jgi:hypothetical protein
MTTLLAHGMDAGNPLHFLASLGLLRLADRLDPGARLGFVAKDLAWRPRVEAGMERTHLLEEMAHWILTLGRRGAVDPALAASVRGASVRVKKKAEGLKNAARTEKERARKMGLSKAAALDHVARSTAALRAEYENLKRELSQAQEAAALANGLGIAHFGDIIGVDAEIFRRFGEAALGGFHAARRPEAPETADPPLLVALLPALACDQVLQGDCVQPTPFSFANGASEQKLLKSFLACAALVTAERLDATVQGHDSRLVEGKGLTLNWDPEDLRSYALAWSNPESVTKKVDVAANALAYLGLSLLPAMPTPRGLGAVGWNDKRGWTWPIWQAALPVDVVMSLLAASALQEEIPDRRRLARRGVVEVRRSEILNPTGKRNFFAPSQAI